MAEGAGRSPLTGKRALMACLAILLGIVAFNDASDPVVRTFGLAHAKLVSADSGRVLVLDSLPSADAPAVQTVFQGEIWGRHAYRVHQVLFPFLLLLAAMAGLCHLLAHHVSGVGSRFFHLHRGSAPPPVSLWVALFMGGCLAAWSAGWVRFHLSFALLPLVLALLLTAVLSLGSQPSALTMARSFGALSAARWFWLGFLALSPHGLFRYEGPVDGFSPLSVSSAAACVLALAALHWATGLPRQLDLSRYSGDTAHLRGEAERLSLLAIQELWLLFPAVLMGAVVSSVRIEQLVPYLGASVACALVLRACLQSNRHAWGFRVVTLLLLLGLPFAGQLSEMLGGFTPPLVGWLLAIAVGLAWGRPGSPADPSVVAETSSSRSRGGKPSLAALALSLATVAVVGTALRGGLPLPASDPVLAKAQAGLAGAFGHQARLLALNGQALLVGCNLDVGRLSLAAEIVSKHLPDTETRVVSVRTRRWERVGRFFLAVTVTLFLVVPTYFLTFGAPGPSSRSYMAFCAVVGGANGAFAVGAALGWFWMDPMPHLAAFLLSAGLGWLGLGHARAWVDSRITNSASLPGLWSAPGGSTVCDTL